MVPCNPEHIAIIEPSTLYLNMEHLLQFSRIKLLLCFSMCIAPFSASAQIFKCVDSKTGAKTYSGTPCAISDRATTIATPHYPTTSTLRPTQFSASQTEQVRSETSGHGERLATPGNLSSRSDASHDKANSIECEHAKRKLAVRKSRVTRFSTDVNEPAIDIRAACGIAQPAYIASNPVGGTTVVDIPVQLVNCDPSGCWDTRGRRYLRAGDVLTRPNGGVCTQAGTQWVCP